MWISRRVMLLSVGAIALVSGWAAPAVAQDSPPPEAVLAEQITRVAPAELPRTGSNAMPEVTAGLALTAVGTILVLGTRRRRATAKA